MLNDTPTLYPDFILLKNAFTNPRPIHSTEIVIIIYPEAFLSK